MKPAIVPSNELAELLAGCESVCHAGSLRVDDASGQVHLSSGLRQMLGVPQEAPVQTLDALSWIPESERRLVAHLWRHATPDEPFEIQHRVTTADGRTLQVLHRATRKSTATGSAAGHAILVDLSSTKALESRLKELTHAHETTGLPNRLWLINKIEHAVATSAGDGRSLSVLSIAVPRITELGGTMGFEAADALATALAERLTQLQGRDEWVGQLGPAEFALVIRHPRRDDPTPTRVRAREVINALLAPVSLSSLEVFPTCRVGVSTFPADGTTGVGLLESAQAARNDASADTDLAFHTAQSSAQTLREMQIESRLRQALSHNEFHLVFQPQVSLNSGAILGVEALLRWSSEQGETYRPADFIPVAERTGLVAPIGEWVIHEACAQVVRWRQAGLAAIKVAINLSPVQFQIGDVEKSLHEAMAATGAQPCDLCLEITEGALLHDAARVSATLRKLRAEGFEIALDDFGAGYSSLGRLRSLPIDVLKMDRAFVKDLAEEPNSTAIIRSIINLAHGLNIRVLAEGVETEGQLAVVLSSGCDELQGYFFARPADATAIEDMLRHQRRLDPQHTQQRTQNRTLLLVDDEENILSALKRLFRRDGYKILTANSGLQALELLATTEVDVIISDQRMPGMPGVDFLRKAKEIWPHTIRMTLSGFTDLQSIIDAVNEGAVFKFLTKPWDDDRLREHVAQAFRQKEMADENRRLTHQLATASVEQAALNRRLEALLERQRQDTSLAEAGAGGIRDLVEQLPVAVLGLDPEGMLAFANRRAFDLFPQAAASLGGPPDEALVALRERLRKLPQDDDSTVIELAGKRWRGWLRRLDPSTGAEGEMLVYMPCCHQEAP